MWILVAAVVSCFAMVPSCMAATPQHTWATVPLFWHAGNQTGPFNDTLVDFVARQHKTWFLATVEKFQAAATPPRNTDAEGRIVAAARQLKQARPSLATLFYLNSVMDWPEYNLHKTMQANPSWWLHGRDGKPVYISAPGQPGNKIYVFDHSQAVVRDAWLGVLRQAKATGWIDGCFIDRGNTNATTGQGGSAHWDLTPEQKAAWDAGHARLLAASGALFAEGVVMANNQNYPGVNGRMYESFGNDFQGGWAKLEADIMDLQQTARDHYVELHGEPKTDGRDIACPDDVFNITLAAFLVGAGNRSFYACTDGWGVPTGWDQWRREYDEPLGAPLGDAAHVRGPSGATVFTRAFASGTHVSLSIPAEGDPTACICWSQGVLTGPAACAAVCATAVP